MRRLKLEKHTQLNIEISIKRSDIAQCFTKTIKCEHSWKGPSELIAFDGTISIIRQGAKVVDGHLPDIRKSRSAETIDQQWGTNQD